MRLLLDTHVALWALTDDPRLKPAARTLIADPANEVCVSAATVWEITIKHGLNRKGAGAMPISGQEAHRLFLSAGYALIPILPSHAAALESLPPLHADPFDRLLIAQALTEPLRLITHDAAVAAYGETIILI